MSDRVNVQPIVLNRRKGLFNPFRMAQCYNGDEDKIIISVGRLTFIQKLYIYNKTNLYTQKYVYYLLLYII